MSSAPKWTYEGVGLRTPVNLTELQLGRIKREGLQARAEMDPAHVEALAEAYGDAQRRRRIPPIIVFSGLAPDADGKFTGGYFLADGHHRVAAALRAGLTTIRADVQIVTGTKDARRAALLFAVGANATHGLRRTNQDKRRAVEVLLADPEWATWSDREIGKRAGVSHTFVASLRPAQLATVASSPEADAAPDEADQAAPAAEPKRIGADGKARALPKPKAKPEAPAEDDEAEPDAGEIDDSPDETPAAQRHDLASESWGDRAQVAAEQLARARAALVAYLATAPDPATLTAEEREEQIGTLKRIRDAARGAQEHAAELVVRSERALGQILGGDA